MKAAFPFWTLKGEDALTRCGSSINGLSAQEAAQRLKSMRQHPRSPFVKGVVLFLSQFRTPLTLLLVLALLLSSVLGDFTQSSIIFGILFLSGVLSFVQEWKAGKAAGRLLVLVQSKSKVKRDGVVTEVPLNQVVDGDIVLLEAGDIVPADCLILELKDLYVNEGVLTGESYPSEKKLSVVAEESALLERANSVFKGTSVVSGTATVLAMRTAGETELGEIESELRTAAGETAFEHGIRRFGYMLMQVGLVLAGTIMIVNIFFGRNPLESALFSLALSLGLTPEMLPAIVTITLAAGAKRLARKKVIVKKLSSIQNLGGIDVLCCDKTGTLTEGEVKVHSCISPDGKISPLTQKLALINATFQSGYSNPMDEAIKAQSKADISGYSKYDEVPYDFIRKRLSIVVSEGSSHIMICKGALKNILDVCDTVLTDDGRTTSIAASLPGIQQEFESASKSGYRVIGVCWKDVTHDPVIDKNDEANMTFVGLVLLNDPPKKEIVSVLTDLKSANVSLKIITGDNSLIAGNIATQIGIAAHRIVSGRELHLLSDEVLAARVDEIEIFSETEPSQKEKIVRALQRKGHVVGYLGDGINDAPALKAADVGISVNNAVDVAKESADMVLMEKDLSVMSDGIREGRKTYLNTLKYIFITVSANFGNMFSMAGASLVLPFLPLLPSQILLTNFLTDIPALSIASDNVDEELLRKPRRWDTALIRRFMIVFGFESSFFDFVTFGVLSLYLKVSMEAFRTGWFVESVVTEVLVLLIIRTRKAFFRSRIGSALLVSSACVVAAVAVIPYLPLAAMIGLVPLPAQVIYAMMTIAIVYAIASELTKRALFRSLNY